MLLVLVAVSPASCCLLFATSTTFCHRYPPYLLPDLPDLPSNSTLLPRLHASTCVACPADDDDEQEMAR